MSIGAFGCWAMKAGDFKAREFDGTTAGLTAAITYCGSNGHITLFPGNSSITVPALPAGVSLDVFEAGGHRRYAGSVGEFTGTGGKRRNIYNVTDYADVATAIAAVPDGAKLYFPADAGPYTPPDANGWTINKRIEMFSDSGSLFTAPTLKYFNSAGAANKDSRIFDLVAGAGLYLHDIHLGNNAGTPATIGVGDAIRHAGGTLLQDLILERVAISYAGRNAIRCEGASYLIRVTLKDCTIYGCKGDGAYLNLAAFVTMTGTTFTQNKGAGLMMVNVGNGFFLQINSESNGDDLTNVDYDAQIRLDNCNSGQIAGCNIEDFVATTVYNGIVLNACRAISVTGNEFDGVAGNGRSIHILNGTKGCFIGPNQHSESDESVRIDSVSDTDNIVSKQHILNGTGAIVIPAGSRNGVLNVGVGPAIASAATIAIPTHGEVFHVTGTTNITNGITVNAHDNGRLVTLIFDGVLTVSDTGTSKLTAALVTTADDTLTLRCDGTNWYEVSRSVN